MNNYINEKYYKSDVTSKVIECAYRVHKQMGIGFQEVIYQRALEIEFLKTGISFHREKEMPIFYDQTIIGTRRVDFLVDNDIMIELKALTVLEDVHIAQLMNYIEAYGVRIGLLINFGAKKLEIKRFIK